MKQIENENIISFEKNGINYLQFKRLLEYKDIIQHAYCLGTDVDFRTSLPNKGKISDEKFNNAINDYKNLCDSLDLDYLNIVKTNQEHTDNIQIVNKKQNENGMDINLEVYDKTDGFITNKSNLVLATTNADCILMLFFDPKTKTIANIHSGWKGTLLRISEKTVKKMIEQLKVNPKDLICCICPSIRQCHFEVDKEVKDCFKKEFSCFGENQLNKIIKKQENVDKWNIDTVLINKLMLLECGLDEKNIIDSGLCSVCNSEIMHSFRVEKDNYGLSTAIISLK